MGSNLGEGVITRIVNRASFWKKPWYQSERTLGMVLEEHPQSHFHRQGDGP